LEVTGPFVQVGTGDGHGVPWWLRIPGLNAPPEFVSVSVSQCTQSAFAYRYDVSYSIPMPRSPSRPRPRGSAWSAPMITPRMLVAPRTPSNFDPTSRVPRIDAFENSTPLRRAEAPGAAMAMTRRRDRRCSLEGNAGSSTCDRDRHGYREADDRHNSHDDAASSGPHLHRSASPHSQDHPILTATLVLPVSHK
jgi:hypothetical protein